MSRGAADYSSFWSNAGYSRRQIRSNGLSAVRPPEAGLANTPLPELMTSGRELDQQLLSMLLSRGRSRTRSKGSSRRLKFIDFCVAEGYMPVPIPTPPVMYMRFMLWLPNNGISSGWKGCLAYVTELANWNLQLGFKDRRDEISYWWSTFRLNFKNMVTNWRKHAKLPLRPWMFMALLDSALQSPSSQRAPSDLRDAAAYSVLYFTSQRIGHVGVSSAAGQVHALRFGSLLFYPSLRNPQMVFVYFHSTKTRGVASGTGYWTAISVQPQLRYCPVQILRLHFTRTYSGNQDGFLFQMANGSPMSRSCFTTNLRSRLHSAGVDASKYSGISFRKGALSTLGAANVPSHKIADFADHADVQTSRIYMMDTMVSRAATGQVIGDALISCNSWSTLPSAPTSMESIPVCAAVALTATDLFESVDDSYRALLAADSQLPANDRATREGFSWSAVLNVVCSRTAAVDLSGIAAQINAHSLLASGKVLIVLKPGHFVALTPAADGWSWSVTDSEREQYIVSNIPQDAQAVLVVGTSDISGLRTV